MMVKPVEVEVDGPRCEDLIFAPLQRRIRGRLDFLKVGEPMAAVEAQNWPGPIPGQRLGIDREGTGYIAEPLHDPRNGTIKERIEAKGMKLEPKTQVFDSVDAPTWLFWIKQAVEAGIAKVVSGKLPDKIDGKVQMNFVTNEPAESPVDKLTAAIERQTATFEKLLERLSK